MASCIHCIKSFSGLLLFEVIVWKLDFFDMLPLRMLIFPLVSQMLTYYKIPNHRGSLILQNRLLCIDLMSHDDLATLDNFDAFAINFSNQMKNLRNKKHYGQIAFVGNLWMLLSVKHQSYCTSHLHVSTVRNAICHHLWSSSRLNAIIWYVNNMSLMSPHLIEPIIQCTMFPQCDEYHQK